MQVSDIITGTSKSQIYQDDLKTMLQAIIEIFTANIPPYHESGEDKKC
jgi:hypothetical protein